MRVGQRMTLVFAQHKAVADKASGDAGMPACAPGVRQQADIDGTIKCATA
jgi:hypothetical protein